MPKHIASGLKYLAAVKLKDAGTLPEWQKPFLELH